MPNQPREALDRLADRLKGSARSRRRTHYRIPAIWNCWGYAGASHLRGKHGLVVVAPKLFLAECLERVILPARDGRRLGGKSLSRSRGIKRLTGNRVQDGGIQRRGGDWIRRANIYGMLVRLTTAWDHHGDGHLQPNRRTKTGTFLKSILILPLLARMGIDAIYMLPVTKISRAFRKGEIGCPYAAKNFFELEPDLRDSLLDPKGLSLEEQFAAFVEAAHAMGIRVLVDLAPRTASRDSDFLLKHPEWFYWIDIRTEGGFGPPMLPEYESGIPKPSQLKAIHNHEAIRSHLAKFRHAPNVTEPQWWQEFVKRCRRRRPRDLLGAIGREFGVITPPGFSDCMNDPQPPWSDVTFFRLFLDHPIASAPHLLDAAAQPPYVFTDTIKASKFPGRRPNRPLWRKLANILPFYQRFGIDGARIDMGHALPPELQRMIIEKPRQKDPDFAFLAEELSHDNDRAARRDGYNAIIGASWYHQPRHRNGELHIFVRDMLPAASLPVLATPETPDTPRAVMREGGKGFARLVGVLNYFLPSAIPFVNSGFELLERQPLNLGLDMLPSGRFTLPRSDPDYGKLAYFDRTALHWRNSGATGMIAMLALAADLRRQFIDDLADARNYFPPIVATSRKSILAIGWQVEAVQSALIVVANIDFHRKHRAVLSGLPDRFRRRRTCTTLFEIQPSAREPVIQGSRLHCLLEPGDVKVLQL